MDAMNNEGMLIQDLWLADFLLTNDLLVLDITENIENQQQAIGQVRHCYTSMYASAGRYATGSLRFITGPTSWGNTPPKKGERVLISVSYLPIRDPKPSVRMYEYYSHGHFVIREVDGQLCATVNYPLKDIWNVPQAIRDAIFPVPDARRSSAFPFSLLEDYVMTLIARVHRIQPVRSSLLSAGGVASLPFSNSTGVSRLPNKVMSRRDFEVFRAVSGRRQAYLAVGIDEPRDLWAVEPECASSPAEHSTFFRQYCLHGAYSRDGVNLWRPPTGEQLRSEINASLGADRVSFGTLDTWEYRDQPRPPILFFEPDGDVYPLLGEANMKSHYALRGLPWGFPRQVA